MLPSLVTASDSSEISLGRYVVVVVFLLLVLVWLFLKGKLFHQIKINSLKDVKSFQATPSLKVTELKVSGKSFVVFDSESALTNG